MPLQEIPEGAICQSDITDAKGNLIAGQGQPLTAVKLKALEKTGVPAATVAVEDGRTLSVAPSEVNSTLDRFMLNDTTQPPFPTLIALCESNDGVGG